MTAKSYYKIKRRGTGKVSACSVDKIVAGNDGAAFLLFLEVSHGVLAAFGGATSGDDDKGVHLVSFLGDELVLGIGSFHGVLEHKLDFVVGDSLEEGKILNEFSNVGEVLRS